MAQPVKMIVPVRNLTAAKTVYAALLGVQPYIDESDYVGFRVGNLEIGLDLHGRERGMTGPVSYWHTDDIASSLRTLLGAGAAVRQDVTNAGGRLTATVSDADGNVMGLVQPHDDAPVVSGAALAEENYSVTMSRELFELAQKAATPYDVSPVIHPYDFMYRFLLDHVPLEEAVSQYFDGGRDWAAQLAAFVYDRLGYSRDSETPLSLLEFAAGYGRVSRHLRAALPNAAVVACDIHPQAVKFLRAGLGVRSMQSAMEPAEAHLGLAYDAIVAQSFFSHMPPRTFGTWLSVLGAALKPGGHLLFTTRGENAIARSGSEFGAEQIPERGWFFVEKSEQFDLDTADYGSMFVNRSYVEEQLGACAVPMEIVAFEPDGWYVQDLYVARRLP